MSDTILAAARELIDKKKYVEARDLLRTIPDDPTAKKWIEKLNQRIGEQVKSQPKGGEPKLYALTDEQMKMLQGRQKDEKKKKRSNAPGCLALIVILIVVAYWIGEGANRDAARNENSTIAAAAALANLPTNTPGPSPTPRPMPTPSNSEIMQEVADGVSILAGGRNLDTVRLADGRANGGERALFISYLTTESTEVGYVDEWIDIFEAVASSVDDEFDIDSVALVAGTAAGGAAGIIVVSMDDLNAFVTREISRAEFLSRLERTNF